jgi:chloride channel protein, CIC family
LYVWENLFTLPQVKFWFKTIESVAARGRHYIERHWEGTLRLRERLRLSEETIHLVLAVGVGIIGGVCNLAFSLGNELLKQLAVREPGDLVDIASRLPAWQLLLIPSVGVLAAGLVLCWGGRIVQRQGSGNILEVVVAGDGRLRLRSALIKAASSLISISTGASIGREGSITQLSATFSSKWGQLARWQPYRLRLLVACGAASGLAAAYNAPVAGAVFAAQIVLGNFSMHLFGPLVLSAVVAAMVSRSFFGFEPLYHVPTYDFTSLTQLPWFFLLGIASGVVGAVFLKLLHYSEIQFNRLPLNLCLRLAVAGLVVGAIAIFYPDVLGNGYAATHRLLREPMPLQFITGLFVAKVLAILITVGAGTVGGVFTPTLFIGAALGSFFGTFLHQLGWVPMTPGAFALVGMGSVLSATVRSPLLAMIMVFELSLNYSLMPPLMLACALSTLVAGRLHPDSIYTEPLRQKGLEVGGESVEPGVAFQKTVGDLMREPVPPVKVTASLPQIAERFLTSSNNFLPVVDNAFHLVGQVSLQDLKEHLNAGQELSSVIAYDIMQPPPICLTPNQRLVAALPILLASEQRHIPVVNSLKQNHLVGALVRAEALGLLSEAIAKRGGAPG